MKHKAPIQLRFEAIIWLAALIGLAVAGPSLHGHVSFCIPTLLGFDGCWGCGLGIGIAETLRGNVAQGFDHHMLAPIAVLVLFFRIVQLTFPSLSFAGDSHGQCFPISSGS